MSKELTALKALQNLTEYLTGDYRDCFEELSIIGTALKALEIIKVKGVNVDYLKYHFEKGNGGYREYKRVMNTPYLDYYPSAEMLTKEEFDLLRKALL